MNNVTIYATYVDAKPQVLGIKIGENVTIYELYTGEKKRLYDIHCDVKKIRKLILAVTDRGALIKTSDFKELIKAFDLPLDIAYNVYELPTVSKQFTKEEIVEKMPKILERLDSIEPMPYQKLLANAQIVYQDLENEGFYINYSLVHPTWSVKTFSGRGKSSGNNIQGYYEPDHLRARYSTPTDISICFDWVCADIRIASILSGDKNLQRSFNDSDPYTYMMNIINEDSEDKLSRDECKIMLLKAINSMDVDNQAINDIFPDLIKWIRRCDHTISEGGALETILHRRFTLNNSKNKLAVLNGVMQGSVAHGMQNVLYRTWEKFRGRIITDIHDSLVINCTPAANDIRRVVAEIAPIMSRPFEGLLPDNPVFPIRVYVGREWKTWKPCPSLLKEYDFRVTDT